MTFRKRVVGAVCACLMASCAFAAGDDKMSASPEAVMKGANLEAQKGAQLVEIQAASQSAGGVIAAAAPANAYWISPRGSFHMTGTPGKGIFEYAGYNYDSTFGYVKDGVVSGYGTKGVIYKMTGYQFWLFLATQSGGYCPSGQYFIAANTVSATASYASYTCSK